MGIAGNGVLGGDSSQDSPSPHYSRAMGQPYPPDSHSSQSSSVQEVITVGRVNPRSSTVESHRRMSQKRNDKSKDTVDTADRDSMLNKIVWANRIVHLGGRLYHCGDPLYKIGR